MCIAGAIVCHDGKTLGLHSHIASFTTRNGRNNLDLIFACLKANGVNTDIVGVCANKRGVELHPATILAVICVVAVSARHGSKLCICRLKPALRLYNANACGRATDASYNEH